MVTTELDARPVRSRLAPPIPPAAGPPRQSSWQLFRDSVPLLMCHRGWLTSVVSVGVLYAILDPMQGIVIKQVADGLAGKSGTPAETIARYIPLYIAILCGLAILQFFEKSLKGFYDPLITFDLQRIYLGRRPDDDDSAIVSRLQYDCRDARKAIEVYVRDLPAIVVGMITVLAVQWSLAPEWLPALILIIIPNLTLTFWLGRPIRRSNHEMFVAVTEVARTISPDRMDELVAKQQSLYGRLWRRESWMGFSEVMMQLTIWIGCLLVVFCYAAIPDQLGLSKASPGGLALFVANVNFLSKPLINIGKAYNKYCSTEPALRRALYE